MKIRDRIVELRRVKASELHPNPKNWRTHPEQQLDAIRGVLAEVGFAGAELARQLPDGSLQLIDGHARAEVAGDAEVPVLILDVDEKEADLILSTYDPIGNMAGANVERLDDLLKGVMTNNEALQQALDDLATTNGLYTDDAPLADDDIPLPPKDPVTQPGDVWTLGDHRLICGDSTDAKTVDRLFNGAMPNVMITDPPYGVQLDQSWRDKALGDKAMGPGNARVVDNDDRADWTATWQLFKGDVAYVWHASRYTDVVIKSLRDSGFELCQQLIWNKSIMVMGRCDYHFKHEPCWYAIRKGKPHGWTGDRKQTTVIDAPSPNHIMSGSTDDKTNHPTQKPIACMGNLLRNHGGDVYDPFIGSGTTLIAAEQLDRACYAIDLSPGYVDVVVERWQALSGKKATRSRR